MHIQQTPSVMNMHYHQIRLCMWRTEHKSVIIETAKFIRSTSLSLQQRNDFLKPKHLHICCMKLATVLYKVPSGT